MAFTKSLTQEQFDQKHAEEVEIAKRELERKSHDNIRIYNPMEHSFRYMYDRYWHTVPAKSYKDVQRYLAIHYFKKICDYMIGQQILAKGEELKKLRERQLGKQYLDKYEENTQVWDRVPRLNDPELIEQIKGIVIVGLVEEYGMEEPEPDLREPIAPIDFRPMHEQIMGEIKPISSEMRSVDIETSAPEQVDDSKIEDILKAQTEERKQAGKPNKSKVIDEITK